MKALSILFVAAGLSVTSPAWAGPPLICQQFDIGSAASLPWKSGADWHGADPSYNLAHLSADTLALLTPSAPVRFRMETLRRAAIYATSDRRLPAEVMSRLMARVLDVEAAGKSDPLIWFDAGYFAETVRQATFVYRYNMLTQAEKTSWQLRGDTPRVDGYPWVQKAIRQGGISMDYALSLMTEFRNEDLKANGTVVALKP